MSILGRRGRNEMTPRKNDAWKAGVSGRSGWTRWSVCPITRGQLNASVCHHNWSKINGECRGQEQQNDWRLQKIQRGRLLPLIVLLPTDSSLPQSLRPWPGAFRVRLTHPELLATTEPRTEKSRRCDSLKNKVDRKFFVRRWCSVVSISLISAWSDAFHEAGKKSNNFWCGSVCLINVSEWKLMRTRFCWFFPPNRMR